MIAELLEGFAAGCGETPRPRDHGLLTAAIHNVRCPETFRHISGLSNCHETAGHVMGLAAASVIECPAADADAALECLGQMLSAGQVIWVKLPERHSFVATSAREIAGHVEVVQSFFDRYTVGRALYENIRTLHERDTFERKLRAAVGGATDAAVSLFGAEPLNHEVGRIELLYGPISDVLVERMCTRTRSLFAWLDSQLSSS